MFHPFLFSLPPWDEPLVFTATPNSGDRVTGVETVDHPHRPSVE